MPLLSGDQQASTEGQYLTTLATVLACDEATLLDVVESDDDPPALVAQVQSQACTPPKAEARS